MDITPIIPADRQVIDTYGPGIFRVSNQVHEGAVIVQPGQTIPWPVTSFAALTLTDFAPLLGLDPKVEVLLVGCGPRMQLMPSALRRQLREAGIVADVMDSPAACRTYNILLAEGRRVAAALLPV
ncbi:Mth938-like domain-containing protein [Niveispirillum irakense]|uniref:Mth938-like domain-containing protein n=1 Tax=Niveispirillum irakense TaxID=34011 RepID=UPI000403C099|nr:Mth938-like domain-containing protein [Niveispirillum irakense]